MREWTEEDKRQYEAQRDAVLAEGHCPDSGEKMRPVMDWWNRRVLMCPNCDCFGYPLVMSDGPGETCSVQDRPADVPVKKIDIAELDW